MKGLLRFMRHTTEYWVKFLIAKSWPLLLLLRGDWLLKTYDSINLHFDSSLNTSCLCAKVLYRKSGQLIVKIKELQWKQNQKAKTHFEIFLLIQWENVFPASSTIPAHWCQINQKRLKRLLHNSLHIFSAYLAEAFCYQHNYWIL